MSSSEVLKVHPLVIVHRLRDSVKDNYSKIEAAAVAGAVGNCAGYRIAPVFAGVYFTIIGKDRLPVEIIGIPYYLVEIERLAFFGIRLPAGVEYHRRSGINDLV